MSDYKTTPVKMRLYESDNKKAGRSSIGKNLIVFVNEHPTATGKCHRLVLGCPDPNAEPEEFIEAFEDWSSQMVERIRSENGLDCCGAPTEESAIEEGEEEDLDYDDIVFDEVREDENKVVGLADYKMEDIF